MKRSAVLLFISGCFLSACAVPQQMELIEREQRRLRAENVNVRGETGEIKTEFDRVRRSLADTRANVEELRRDVDALKGKIDEMRYALERQSGQAARDGDQKAKSLEAKLARMDEEMKAQAKLFKAQEEELRNLKDGLAAKKIEAQTELAKAKGAGEEAEKKAYEEALKLMDQKDFRTAIGRFKEFLKNNPNSELADNAQYWVGECHYALKEFDQSILEFDAVRRKYPNGDKVPAALLKQGFAFAELGDRVDARLILQELIERYPLSAEATKAKERLKTLRS
jgi:tol-pal system protein YbgF